LVTNAYGPRDEQREQVFPNHLECFRRVLNEDDLVEIAAPEYPTVGDFRHEYGDESGDSRPTGGFC
jgi:hypothetical protein